MKILVTGGCGFMFSNFIRYMLKKYPNYQIINLDALTYAGRLENTEDFKDNKNYTFIKGSICDFGLVNEVMKRVDWVVNAAAETHVDRSILEPGSFIQTDVYGTYVLLEAIRKHKIKKAVFISTDEVYGDMENKDYAKENDPLRPSSPYAASKAGGDLQVMAFRRTYNLPVIITRSSNNYGPYQYPEKIIPLFITNLLENKKVPVYGDGKQIRDWLYVDDNSRAIDLVLHKGKVGEIYNIGANQKPEITNLELTKQIIQLCQKDESFIEYVEDRPGHDRRYALDTTKIRTLGWKPEISLEEGLEKTVLWYRENENWWKKIKSGEYLEYYKRQYGQRTRQVKQPYAVDSKYGV